MERDRNNVKNGRNLIKVKRKQKKRKIKSALLTGAVGGVGEAGRV